ncbi:MAG: hypothetical protein ACLTSZ_04965 [Lachnospiraceae bacterium]
MKQKRISDYGYRIDTMKAGHETKLRMYRGGAGRLTRRWKTEISRLV